MNPANKDQVLPLILTGPKESADYFRVLDEFVVHTLGENARRHYRIIIDDAAEVARQMKKSMPLVKENRRDTGDAYSFNWSMRIAPDLQMPFEPSHENMANLKLYPDQPVEVLAADLRRAFSGIVAGNVKKSVFAPLKSLVLTKSTATKRLCVVWTTCYRVLLPSIV